MKGECDRPYCKCHKGRMVHCPVHGADSEPSLSVAVKNGKTLYHCFAGCDQQKVWDAMKEERPVYIAQLIPKRNLTNVQADVTLLGVLSERASKAKSALQDSPETLLWLQGKYGWSDQTMARMNLGLEDGRILYPSQDYDGAWYYTTRRGPGGVGAKYLHEYGRAPIVYNYRAPVGVVWLCEGHSDTVTAEDLGYRAVGLLGTSSARKALPYLQMFRQVNIVMDADSAGYKATKFLNENLDNATICYLGDRPEDYDTGEPYISLGIDLTEYRLKYGDEATKDRMETYFGESTTPADSPRSGGGGASPGPRDFGRGSPAGGLSEARTLRGQDASENLSRGLGYLASRWKT